MGWYFLWGPFRLWRVKLLNNPKLAQNVLKRLNIENKTEPEAKLLNNDKRAYNVTE
jgi:hypothetical protein